MSRPRGTIFLPKKKVVPKSDTFIEQKLHFLPSLWLHWANTREELRTPPPITAQTWAGPDSWSMACPQLHRREPAPGAPWPLLQPSIFAPRHLQPGHLPCPGLLRNTCKGSSLALTQILAQGKYSSEEKPSQKWNIVIPQHDRHRLLRETQ